MKLIQKTDEIFHYLTVEEANNAKDYNDFACFRWEGANWLAFYMYADNYYNAAFQLLEDTKNNRYSENYQPCQNIDSIIYPICFLYRQFVELTLKWLYLKYASLDDEGRKEYLKHANHDVIQCWRDLKPFLEKKLSIVKCDCTIDAIEHYINEWNQFDEDSFKMRYPCNKEKESFSLAGSKLDVITLKERMSSFHDSINYVDGCIENTMYDFGSRLEKSKFWNKFAATKEKIERFIAKLEQSDEKKIIPHPTCRFLSSNEATRCVISFFNDLASDERIVVEIIYLVSSSSCNWPKSKYQSQQAFLSACVSQMQIEHFEFGKPVDDSDISFNNKNKRVLLPSLMKALSLLEKE
jgi:hypothetical protein